MKNQALAITLSLIVLAMIPIYSDAQTPSQSCSDEKGCAAGLQCIKFPEGRRCDKPNPCSYYQCPQWTRCFVNINVGRPAKAGEAIIQSSPSAQTQSPDIRMQTPSDAQDAPAKSGSWESKPVGVSTPQPVSGISAPAEKEYGGGLSDNIVGILETPPTKDTDVIRVGCGALIEPASMTTSREGAAPATRVDEPTRAQEASRARVQEFELIYSAPVTRSLGGYAISEEVPTGVSRSAGGSGGSATTGSGVIAGPGGSEVRTASPNAAPVSVSVWKSVANESTVSALASDEKFIIQANEASAEYVGGAVTVDNEKLTIETPQGKQAIEVMPNIAVAQAQEAVKEAEVTKVELKADAKTGAPSYQVSTKKNAKLFWFIPVTVKAETRVSAKTGEITSVKKPWWNIFAR